MALIKQSTTYTRTFLMVDSSDHLTGKTGLSPAVRLSKAGAATVVAGGTVTEIDSANAPGLYKIALTTTDTNTLGDLAIHATAGGADPSDPLPDQVIALDPTIAWPTNFSSLSIDGNGRVKGLISLTKNVAVTGFTFMMTDSTNHLPKTGITGGSFTKQYSLDGAAFSSLSNTITEIASGLYKINLTAGEVNGTIVVLRFAAAASDDTVLTIITSQ